MHPNPSKSRPYSDKPLQRRPFSAARPTRQPPGIPSQTLQVASLLPNLPDKDKDPSNPKSGPIKPLSEKNMHQFFEAPVTYRIAHPAKSTYLVSLEFWKENNQNNKSLVNWSNLPLTGKERPLSRGFSQPQPEDPIQLEQRNPNPLLTYQKPPTDNSQPFTFLASLGGKKTSLTQFTSPSVDELPSLPQEEESLEGVARNIQAFSKLDMDRSIRAQLKRQQSAKQARPQTSSHILQVSTQFRVGSAVTKDKRLQSAATGMVQPEEKMVKTAEQIGQKAQKQRPMTAGVANPGVVGKKTMSARNRVLSGKTSLKSAGRKAALQNQIMERNQDFFEEELDIREDFNENDEFYEKAEAVQGMNFRSRPKSNLLTSRPISGKSAAPEQFFNTFTKYAKFNDIELPYEDLFDRNERTIAATYAKFGDLGYYSPVQRIGAYMQFSAKLKRDHLIEIINLQKTSKSIKHNEIFKECFFISIAFDRVSHYYREERV